MKNIFIMISLFMLIISLTGCSHVLSKDVLETLDKNVSKEEIFKNPETYKGKIVILGGVIIQTTNTKEGTYIEVLEQERDSFGNPKGKRDISLGRFIIFYEGYLDNAIYKSGRQVTIGGELIGKRVANIGEIEYSYPFIKSKEIHLFAFDQNYYPSTSYGFGVGIMRRF